MSKSKDLREAAVMYQKEGHTYEETGNLSDKPLNKGFKKIDPEKLKAYVAEYPNDTQEEVLVVFGCCPQAVSKAYKRRNNTKKRHSAIKNKVLKK